MRIVRAHALRTGLLLTAQLFPLATVRAEGPKPPSETATLTQARTEFEHATDYVQKARWSEALAAFERAQALRPHALTLFNIGACQRAMGMYTLARSTFHESIANAHELGPSLIEQARGFTSEIDTVIARLHIVVRGPETSGLRIAVDGRPLLKEGELRVSGVKPAGLPEREDAVFDVLMNPGHHVLVVLQEGSQEAAVALDVRPGERSERKIDLARLPATLQVNSDLVALVMINGKDSGPTPLEVQRPAGTYRVVLEREHFQPYSVQIEAKAGRAFKLQATLVPEKVAITKRWWFWTGLGALAAGVGVGTYLLARPDPVRPPVSGGGLGWAVPISQ
jgi:hypothetical protein